MAGADIPPVAIFGGRGAGALAAFALRRAAGAQATPPVFLNDFEPRGAVIEGVTVFGPFESWRDLAPETKFLAPLHKAKEMELRAGKIEALGILTERWVNVVDPSAIVADEVLRGAGIWAQAGSMVMPGARVGSHVALRSGAHVSHDCVIGDFVSVGLGAILCGYSVVERGAYIAPGAIVRDGVRVGPYSVVGLGAVVAADVAAGVVVIGNPARALGGKREASG